MSLPELPDGSGRFVLVRALVFEDENEDTQVASKAMPFPVELARGAAGSTPLAGSTSSTGVLGPFTPQLGRPIWLTLSGNWVGTVTVKRSVDGGVTKLPLTAGGLPWGVFSGSVQEPIAEETEDGATYYLDYVTSSGTMTYRLSQ